MWQTGGPPVLHRVTIVKLLTQHVRRLLGTHQWQSALLVVRLPVTQDWFEMGCYLSPSPRVGKLRPAGRMRPSRAFCAAREDFLKLCHLEINTTRGLTRRKSDGVLKKMVIASTLDGKCVGAYNCPQSGIYRLRKGEDLFFF